MSNFYQILSINGTVGKLHTPVYNPPLGGGSCLGDDCSSTDSSTVSMFLESSLSNSECAKQPAVYLPTRSKRDLLGEWDDETLDTFDEIWNNRSSSSSFTDTCDSFLSNKNRQRTETKEQEPESSEEKYQRYRALQSRKHPQQRGRGLVHDQKQDSDPNPSLKPPNRRNYDTDFVDDAGLKIPARETSISPARKMSASIVKSHLRDSNNNNNNNNNNGGRIAPVNTQCRLNNGVQSAPMMKPASSSGSSKEEQIQELRAKVEMSLKRMTASDAIALQNIRNQLQVLKESSGRKSGTFALNPHEDDEEYGEHLKFPAKKILPLSDYYYPKTIHGWAL